MSKLNQRAAKLNEYGLYALLVIEPLAGIGNALFRGKPLALFAWQVPAIMAPEKNVSHMFHAIHEWGGWALLVLVGLHAAAGLFHGLILRDGVFQRMMPWMEPQGPGRDRRMLEKGVPRIGFASDIKLAGNKDADGHDHLRANRRSIPAEALSLAGLQTTAQDVDPAASSLGRPREAFVKPADLAGIKSAAGQFSTLELLC